MGIPTAAPPPAAPLAVAVYIPANGPCSYCGKMRGPIGLERRDGGNGSRPPQAFNEHIGCFKKLNGGWCPAWHRTQAPADSIIEGRGLAISAVAPCRHCGKMRMPIGLERRDGGNRSRPPQAFNEYIRRHKRNDRLGRRPPWH
jgi:hypothetical protein